MVVCVELEEKVSENQISIMLKIQEQEEMAISYRA